MQKHLSDQIGIEYHPDLSVSIYGFNSEEYYVFSIDMFGPTMVWDSIIMKCL